MSAIKKKSIIEAVENIHTTEIPMLSPKDLKVKMSAVVPPTYLDTVERTEKWRDRFDAQCKDVVEKHKDVLDFEDKDRLEGNKPVVAEKPIELKDLTLTEDTHAAVAKPAGDRVKAYNNALRYAKKYGVPYCYGYTNSRLAGKFFAFDQPFKWDGDDKAFRAQYKNALTIYVAHPDKAFIKESLNRSLALTSATKKSLREGYLENVKNPTYWQDQVDYQLKHFGRVGAGLIQDLDENGFYLNADNKVTRKLHEDTIKNSKGKWVNRGEEGTHGEFRTKKEADAQRRAMYANGYGENLTEEADNLDKATPYMLRNDGYFKNVSPIHPYIKYGHETAQQAIEKLSDFRFPALKWFYENTNSADTCQLIGSVVKYMTSSNLISSDQGDFCNDLEDVYLPKKEEIAGFIDELADNTNQEFCRVRTSGILFRGSSNDIYFRISSIRFNWFNLIWDLVNKYKTFISDVTICKDSNTFGGAFEPYKISGIAINHLSVDDFLSLSGNPVVEGVESCTEAINESNKLLKAGKLVSESYDKQLHPIHVHSFYESQVSEFLAEDMNNILSRKNVEGLTEDIEENSEEDVAEEPKAEVKIDLEKFKPWGNAVSTYDQIQEAGKMKDLEMVLEQGWPDGIKDQTLNELLAEDKDWLAEVLDMEFVEKRVK